MAREQGGLGPCRPWAGPGAEAGALLNPEGKVCGMRRWREGPEPDIPGQGQGETPEAPSLPSVSQGSSTGPADESLWAGGSQAEDCSTGKRGLLTTQNTPSHFLRDMWQQLLVSDLAPLFGLKNVTTVPKTGLLGERVKDG